MVLAISDLVVIGIDPDSLDDGDSDGVDVGLGDPDNITPVVNVLGAMHGNSVCRDSEERREREDSRVHHGCLGSGVLFRQGIEVQSAGRWIAGWTVIVEGSEGRSSSTNNERGWGKECDNDERCAETQACECDDGGRDENERRTIRPL